MTAASGAILGAFLAFFIVLTSLPPSTDAIEADAAALVLPGSDMVRVGSNTGATMIVGWDRWSIAEFEDERNQDIVHELLIERASKLGWTVDQAVASELGRIVEASRPLMNARITVSSQMERGERIEESAGRIRVSRNEGRRAVLFWGSVVLAGVAGSWGAHRFLVR